MPDIPIRFTAPSTRHSRAGGNPDLSLVEPWKKKGYLTPTFWIPACAGMTII